MRVVIIIIFSEGYHCYIDIALGGVNAIFQEKFNDSRYLCQNSKLITAILEAEIKN